MYFNTFLLKNVLIINNIFHSRILFFIFIYVLYNSVSKVFSILPDKVFYTVYTIFRCNKTQKHKRHKICFMLHKNIKYKHALRTIARCVRYLITSYVTVIIVQTLSLIHIFSINDEPSLYSRPHWKIIIHMHVYRDNMTSVITKTDVRNIPTMLDSCLMRRSNSSAHQNTLGPRRTAALC